MTDTEYTGPTIAQKKALHKLAHQLRDGLTVPQRFDDVQGWAELRKQAEDLADAAAEIGLHNEQD